MPKTAMIRARTELKLKREVEKIFHELGLTSTEAINIFYRHVRNHRGLPFEVKIPNKTTLNAFRDSEAGKKMKSFKDVEYLIKDLND